MEELNIYEGLTPLKDNAIRGASSKGKEAFIRFSKKGRSYTLSAKVVSSMGIFHGMRVGFIFKRDELLKDFNPWILFVYFTTNPIGTRELKKYKTSSWRVTDTEFVSMIYSRFGRRHFSGDFSLYVNFNLPVKMQVNSRQEICFPVHENIGEFSGDVSSEYKERYMEFIKTFLKQLQ